MEQCACGRPLHYSNPKVEAQVCRLVAERGEFIPVTCMGRKYIVQRHYIALHGIRGVDLPELLSKGIIRLQELKNDMG